MKAWCKYCHEFRTSSVRFIPRVGEQVQLRFCNLAKKKVPGSMEACEDFKLYQYFHCDHYKYFLAPEACLNRIFNKRESCVECSQGLDEIIPMMRGRRKEEENNRPKLLLRRRNNENQRAIGQDT